MDINWTDEAKSQFDRWANSPPGVDEGRVQAAQAAALISIAESLQKLALVVDIEHEDGRVKTDVDMSAVESIAMFMAH